jgi:hypothetical protein
MHLENSLEAHRSGFVARAGILYRAPVDFTAYAQTVALPFIREGGGA